MLIGLIIYLSHSKSILLTLLFLINIIIFIFFHLCLSISLGESLSLFISRGICPLCHTAGHASGHFLYLSLYTFFFLLNLTVPIQSIFPILSINRISSRQCCNIQRQDRRQISDYHTKKIKKVRLCRKGELCRQNLNEYLETLHLAASSYVILRSTWFLRKTRFPLPLAIIFFSHSLKTIFFYAPYIFDQ